MDRFISTMRWTSAAALADIHTREVADAIGVIARDAGARQDEFAAEVFTLTGDKYVPEAPRVGRAGYRGSRVQVRDDESGRVMIGRGSHDQAPPHPRPAPT